jgi:hypothetical protein
MRKRLFARSNQTFIIIIIMMLMCVYFKFHNKMCVILHQLIEYYCHRTIVACDYVHIMLLLLNIVSHILPRTCLVRNWKTNLIITTSSMKCMQIVFCVCVCVAILNGKHD